MQIRNITQPTNFVSLKRTRKTTPLPFQSGTILNNNTLKTRNKFIAFITAVTAMLAVGSCMAKANRVQPPANEAISVMSEYLDYANVPSIERPDF